MLNPHGRFYTRSMRKIATIGIVLFTGVFAVNGDLAEQKKRLDQELLNVPVPELPARAVQIVRSTPAPERSQAAVLAVENIVARHPAAATTTVAAVSKAAPESAVAVAAAATRLAPTQAANIEAAAHPQQGRGNRENQEKGNGNSNGNGNGNSGNGNGNVNRPDHPGQPGRPDKSELLPNGKPRPFPHHGHTDDPNHEQHPKPYNKPRPP